MANNNPTKFKKTARRTGQPRIFIVNRQPRLVRCIQSSLVAFLCLLMPSVALGDSTAWQHPGNNNRILALQADIGDPEKKGAVRIDFYGHAAFKITSPDGLTVMFDPWRNDPSGAWGLWFPESFPQEKVDVVLSTHAHFDHDAVYEPHASMVLDRMSGVWKFADVTITGLADKHVCVSPGRHAWHRAFTEMGINGCPPNNPGHMDNVIFVVHTGGKRIAVWGDNRADPPGEILDQLADLDVLILPIDNSEHLLSFEQSDAIVRLLDPNLVIPAHYLTDGVSSVLSTLGDAKAWIDRHPSNSPINGPSFILNEKTLDGRNQHVVHFLSSHQPQERPL